MHMHMHAGTIIKAVCSFCAEKAFVFFHTCIQFFSQHFQVSACVYVWVCVCVCVFLNSFCCRTHITTEPSSCCLSVIPDFKAIALQKNTPHFHPASETLAHILAYNSYTTLGCLKLIPAIPKATGRLRPGQDLSVFLYRDLLPNLVFETKPNQVDSVSLSIIPQTKMHLGFPISCFPGG